MIFKPLPYQDIMQSYMSENHRCNIYAGMGMGKTSATLYTLSSLLLVEGGKVLVLAPLKVAAVTWPGEVAKWDNLGLTISAIVGNVRERIAAIKKPADIYTTNYENLPWLVKCLGNRWPWNIIVADESTRLKSFRLGGKGGRRARSLKRLAFSKISRFINLTGTPTPNGLIDLWGPMWFIDKGERLGATFTAFKSRWFEEAYYKINVKPNAEKEIMERVQTCSLSILPQDWFDIKEPIMVDVPVHLPIAIRQHYKQLEEEFLFEMKSLAVDAVTAAAKSIKCLQVANGFIYDENGDWHDLHDVKLIALESIIEEANGMPVLVVYHFKPDLIKLKKHFRSGVVLNEKNIAKWNRGEIPIMFVHPASAGHGLNLQDGGNIIVYYAHWWDLEQYLQVLERIGPVRQLQAGYDRPVYVYNIRAVGTLDSDVIARRKSKKTIQDILLEKTRRDIDV